jgi:hypothetical protein
MLLTMVCINKQDIFDSVNSPEFLEYNFSETGYISVIMREGRNVFTQL